MALTPGTRLGVFELVDLLGRGGMGEVYRATDTKLKRQVAIKILPASLATDRDRLARFRREAEVLASLNHPNIAAIYGLEEGDGITALVMELVEGDDLSQKLAQVSGLKAQGLPVDEALPIAKQIAEALEAAHEQGIIHRDLKPANIKVRDDGTVKVLDFGLAKALAPAGSKDPAYEGLTKGPAYENLTQSPTITTPAMTQAGMILGTAAYMSPEQARGKPVDKRTDIWAFGAVLYEMLAGVRPFEGEDATEMIAAVVKTTPNWSALPADVPRSIVTLIQRCLEKDRKARVGDIAVARFLLADTAALGSATPAAVALAPLPRSASVRALPWAVAGGLAVGLLVVLGLWAPWRTEAPVERPLVRLDVNLGADVSLPASAAAASSVIISPDGTRLVYLSGSPPKLFTRRLDQAKATELPGTQGATLPFLSPDGQWVGFVVGRKVNKISVEGGAVVPLPGDAAGPIGAIAKWGEDGSLFLGSRQSLLRIPDGGGAPETIAESRDRELSLLSPEPLPGGNAVLFAADNPGPVDLTTIDVVTLATRERRTVVRGGASPRYLATGDRVGHLVYVNGSTLFAMVFDPRTLQTRGTAVPIVDDIASERSIGTGQFDVSRTGTLVYRRAIAGAAPLRTLQWVDATGKREALPARPGAYQDIRLSPDGRRVALTVIDGASQDVWVYDARRDAMTRLTFGGTQYRAPTWSPDGRYVVFAAVGNGIFQTRADGSGQPEALTQSKTVQYPWSFAPDGRRLAYHENRGGASPGQLWTVPIVNEGGLLKAGQAEAFLTSTSIDRFASFSPDGRWLAYESNDSGTSEVYVRAFPPQASGAGGRWQISASGGVGARWSRSGNDLLYQSGDQILAARYTAGGGTFVADKPRVWVAKLGATGSSLGLVGWDLSPDGTRVMVVTPVASADGSTQEHEVVILQNFFDELRRRVPLGN